MRADRIAQRIAARITDRVVQLLEAPLVVREPLRRLDAIVVLGAPLGPGDRVTPALVERVRAAAALYRDGGAPLIVASGGVTYGASRAEADVIADGLQAEGVPEARILVERESRTTRENARFTAALFAREGIGAEYRTRDQRDARRAVLDPRPIRVWLVTQPFHGRRARRAFRAAGFDAHVWHIDSSLEYRDRGRALRWVVREYAAWAKTLARRQ